MTRTAFITAMISMLLFSSCRTLYLSELSPIHDGCEQLLPALEPVFDKESLEYMYGTSSAVANTRSKSKVSDVIGNQEVEGESSTTFSTYKNPLIMQTKNYFIDDVNTNICERYGKKAGIIRCRIINGYNRSNAYVGLLGWALVGAPFLLGIPECMSESAMQIEVEIYDLAGEVVACYRSDCYSNKDFVALYYGYRNYSDAEGKTNITVLKKAMDDVKDQLRIDFQRVDQTLRTQPEYLQ